MVDTLDIPHIKYCSLRTAFPLTFKRNLYHRMNQATNRHTEAVARLYWDVPTVDIVSEECAARKLVDETTERQS